jgi:hypothetical protein
MSQYTSAQNKNGSDLFSVGDFAKHKQTGFRGRVAIVWYTIKADKTAQIWISIRNDQGTTCEFKQDECVDK